MSRPLALVTGGSAGLGLAFAEALADRGHDLVLVARDADRLQRVASDLRARSGVDVDVLVADLSDRDQLRQVEQRVADPARPVELLVNNAGYGLKRPFLDNDVELEQAMLDVLVTAVLRLSHAALSGMVARGRGRIINVSSVAGYLPRGTYSAAKAYVTQLSVWADLTYRDRGVRTMALCPGFIRTTFHGRMDVGRDAVPSWLWLDADAVVAAALRDLERGKSVSVPDVRYKVLTSAARVVPVGFQARFQSLGRR
jgi:short-subunit dehydrogenase